MALQGDGKIVAVGQRAAVRRLRPRPLQPQRVARPELLRRRQADDRLRRRRRRGERGGAPGRRQDRRGRASSGRRRPARLRPRPLQPDGSLDPSFSGDGKQTTDFGLGFDRANGVALQGDGKIVAVGRPRSSRAATSPSPATTPTARSTRASPATASRRPTSGAATTGDGVALQADGKIVVVGDAAGTASATSPSPATTPTARSTRASPATASRRPTSAGSRRGDRGGAPGRRQDRRGRRRLAAPATTSRSPATTPTARSTRASPATASRRPTSAADDRGDRGGDPGRRQDRRGRAAAVRQRLRPRPLQPERLARHDLLRRRQADDRLRGGSTGRTAVALQADGKIVAVGRTAAASTATSPSPATTPTARSTRASPATASRRPTSGASTAANGVALQGDGKIVAVGAPAAPARPDFALARYNPNGSLDTSFSGDGKQTTDFGGGDAGERRGAPGRRQDRRGRERPRLRTGLRPRPLQPQRLARPELLRRRQQTTSFGGFAGATGVALQGDGKIVAVGIGGPGTISRSLATSGAEHGG